MPRTARAAIGGCVYHVLNRGNNRQRIFRKPADFAAFVQLLIDGKQHADVDLLAYCLMNNHFHLALIPRRDRDLAAYLSWVTNTHVKRYRAHYPDTSGHLYQGRYKSFVVEEDSHLLSLLRYIEANPLRAKLVDRAQDWRWSSLGCDDKISKALLSDWPIDRPRNWPALVNRNMKREELTQIRASIMRDRPLGKIDWVMKMAKRMRMEHTLRSRGRPRKKTS
ncbi:MAG TPA: transposase, partial [Tepidisphaeraceae bacterium]|jgi:putative transposase|nr:transposase [Tepidisphaeraceae bacterium]